MSRQYPFKTTDLRMTLTPIFKSRHSCRLFYRSLNTITIELGQKLGLDRLIEHASAYGITSPIKNEAGSFIGASELTMIELASVYSTIANFGKNPYRSHP